MLAFACIPLCTTVVHNTTRAAVLITFPIHLQTATVAQMLSVKEKARANSSDRIDN